MKSRRPLSTTMPYLVCALIAFALCLCQPQRALAQWTTADGNGNINSTNTNNVGIGTTTANYKLDVSNLVDKGQIRFGLGTGDSGGFLFSNAPSHAVFSGGASWNGGWFAKAISASMVMANTGGIVFFANNGLTAGSTYIPTERMRIDPSGYVGIGTQTPAFDGNVTKYVTLDGGTNVFGSYGAGGNVSSTTGPLGQYAFFNSNLSGEKRNATIVGWNDGATNSGSMAFYTANANVLYERFRVEKNGRIGIGTPTPAYHLDLVSANQWVARFKKTDSTNGGILVEAASGFSPNVALSVNGTIKWYMNSNSGSSDSLQFWESTGLNARLSLTQAGFLGLGIQAPNFKLDVQGGSINASGGLCIASVCKANWSEVGGSSQWSNNGTAIGYANGNVGIGNTSPGSLLYVGSGAVAGGALPGMNVALAGSSYIAASDGTRTAFLGADASGDGMVGTFTNQDFVVRSNNTNRIRVTATGNVGIGVTPAANIKLHVSGDGKFTGSLTVDGNLAAKYQDVAEWVPASEDVDAGTVVILDASKTNHIISSNKAYDTRVAGVISAQPGIALGERGDNKALVATTGRVLVKVDASRAPIHVGDLLVTSDVAGVAMKSEPVNLGGVEIHRPGTIVGKALEPLEKGSGKILVLLSLQ